MDGCCHAAGYLARCAFGQHLPITQSNSNLIICCCSNATASVTCLARLLSSAAVMSSSFIRQEHNYSILQKAYSCVAYLYHNFNATMVHAMAFLHRSMIGNLRRCWEKTSFKQVITCTLMSFSTLLLQFVFLTDFFLFFSFFFLADFYPIFYFQLFKQHRP